MPDAFLARYRGKCAACDGGIHPGEEVQFSSEGPLVHTNCSDAAHTPIEGSVCPHCFLRKALSGECGCDS